MLKPLDQYENNHGYKDGIEVCPVCETEWSYNADSKAIDVGGSVYESVYDGDPKDGPYFHPKCYKDAKVQQMKRDNVTLEAYLNG